MLCNGLQLMPAFVQYIFDLSNLFTPVFLTRVKFIPSDMTIPVLDATGFQYQI